jgi:hypothetical protein
MTSIRFPKNGNNCYSCCVVELKDRRIVITTSLNVSDRLIRVAIERETRPKAIFMQMKKDDDGKIYTPWSEKSTSVC